MTKAKQLVTKVRIQAKFNASLRIAAQAGIPGGPTAIASWLSSIRQGVII